MLILGIESSCDETSCAVLKGRDELLSNVISSSLFRHKPFGGVVPEIASRHSLEQIDVVCQEALLEAGVQFEDLEAIAVTEGPGLIGSLFVGICFAKMLSYQLGIPLIAVNHLEAHLVANFIGKEQPSKFVGLLVSGGHTSLSLHEEEEVKMLGATLDDAVGEAFDKVAKLLGLGYPGGPVIEERAKDGDSKRFRFTNPKLDQPYKFSYSGIKTAVLHEVQNELFGPPASRETQKISAKALSERIGELSESFICDLARGFQDAALGWLVEKSVLAADNNNCEAIVVGGGVSANQFLRESLTEEAAKRNIRVFFPEFRLSLDNAGMIARRGFELHKRGRHATMRLTGNPNLKMVTHS